MLSNVVQFGWGAVQISHLAMITELVSGLKSTPMLQPLDIPGMDTMAKSKQSRFQASPRKPRVGNNLIQPAWRELFYEPYFRPKIIFLL